MGAVRPQEEEWEGVETDWLSALQLRAQGTEERAVASPQSSAAWAVLVGGPGQAGQGERVPCEKRGKRAASLPGALEVQGRVAQAGPPWAAQFWCWLQEEWSPGA